MTYQEACESARKDSQVHSCTIFVTVQLERVPEGARIIGYGTSEWFDSSVVCAYTEGKEKQ